MQLGVLLVGSGPNKASESTVSNTELSEFFGPHPAPLSSLFVCQSELTEFLAELTEFAAEELSEFTLPKQLAKLDEARLWR